MNQKYTVYIAIAVIVISVGIAYTMDRHEQKQRDTETASRLNLPPDPGNGGKITLEGVDSDKDGIRDDIQRYIALSQPDSALHRAALTQAARALQQSILNADNKSASIATANKIFDSMDCLAFVDPENGYSLHSALEAEFMNTSARSKAYNKASAQFSGQARQLTPQSEQQFKCEFDVDK